MGSTVRRKLGIERKCFQGAHSLVQEEGESPVSQWMNEVNSEEESSNSDVYKVGWLVLLKERKKLGMAFQRSMFCYLIQRRIYQTDKTREELFMDRK